VRLRGPLCGNEGDHSARRDYIHWRQGKGEEGPSARGWKQERGDDGELPRQMHGVKTAPFRAARSPRRRKGVTLTGWAGGGAGDRRDRMGNNEGARVRPIIRYA
jgi:hypothetical protein